jgi:hypothetical protein
MEMLGDVVDVAVVVAVVARSLWQASSPDLWEPDPTPIHDWSAGLALTLHPGFLDR